MKYSIPQIDLYKMITKKYGTLPFCQKWIYDYNDTLKESIHGYLGNTNDSITLLRESLFILI